MLLYSQAALVRFRAPCGPRKPTARVACSDEAVQGSAKADANAMELVDLDKVIGGHPRAGLVWGPCLVIGGRPRAGLVGKWWSSA